MTIISDRMKRLCEMKTMGAQEIESGGVECLEPADVNQELPNYKLTLRCLMNFRPAQGKPISNYRF